MNDILAAFVLGNTAILTNVCLLPLYPGLVAFLAGNATRADKPKVQDATAWLGVFVLGGILSTMLLIGLVLFLLQRSFASILTLLLPATYLLIIILGVMTFIGRNPFARMGTSQSPMLNNPYATAYAYGAFLAPMTLPCTGPLILSTFVLGVGSAVSLANGLLFFLAFGLGFGWPLLVLPIVAQSTQRHFITWMKDKHQLLNQVSGILLIVIGIAGIWFELLPLYGYNFTA
ncbi:MAG: cytochrome c biogenesis protein CcdA [Anaerolineae bacterium]|nr:cytochrome c biogenesis protein CcdA [Anaerolineae bacterium]